MPVRAGQELELSGEFGSVRARPTPPYADSPTGRAHPSIASQIARQKLHARIPSRANWAVRVRTNQNLVPNSQGVIVARYPAPCYSGQYSEDASFFYTCTRDMRVHVRDAANAGI